MLDTWSNTPWSRPKASPTYLDEPEWKKTLLSEPESPTDAAFLDESVPQRRRVLTLTTAILASSFLLNVLLIILTNLNNILSQFSDLDHFCAQHGSVYRSPLDDHIPVRYHKEKFNSSLTHDSIYASPASPAVDDAWYDLGIRANHFVLPETVDPSPYGIFPWQAKRDPNLGGGYIVFTEALHQLHCLNMLRKVNHWDYDYYHDRGKDTPQDLFNHTDERLRTHTYHCMDMLRERIQCSADRAVFGMVWIEGDGPFDRGAFPQYSTERKCQDFNALSSWVKSNTIHDEWHEATYQPGDRTFGQDSDLF
jgi:hypothetical protein